MQAFNDYDGCEYVNACETVDEDGNAVSKPNLDTVFTYCQGWKPTHVSHPERDAGWFRKQLSALRKLCAVALDSYHRSGQQDAENEYDEFEHFANGDGRLMYAFLVWDAGTFRFFDRTVCLIYMN